jgi:hypothetical protein
MPRQRSILGLATAVAATLMLTFPSAQTAPASSASTQTAKPAPAPHDARVHHLQGAKTALSAIQESAFTGDARATFVELKKHFTAMETAFTSGGGKVMEKKETPSGSTQVKISQQGNWTAHAEEVDRLLGLLIEPTVGKASPNVTADARQALMNVRKHVTAFASTATEKGPGKPAPKH